MVLRAWTSAEECHVKAQPINEQADRAAHRCMRPTARAAEIAAGWHTQAVWMASLAMRHVRFCESTQASSSGRKRCNAILANR